MKIAILAGGQGTRLRSVVNGVPKPMAPVNGRPFLTYLLDHILQFQCTEIILSVGYLAEVITNYFGQSYCGIPIRYVIENESLGTGGAIQFIMHELQPKEPICILNGDTYLQINYDLFYQQHISTHSKITVALKKIEDCYRYARINMTNGIINSFSTEEAHTTGLINAGVYVCSPDIFNQLNLPKSFSFEKDFMERHITNLNAQGFITNDYFIDIGIPDDYHRFCRYQAQAS